VPCVCVEVGPRSFFGKVLDTVKGRGTLCPENELESDRVWSPGGQSAMKILSSGARSQEPNGAHLVTVTMNRNMVKVDMSYPQLSTIEGGGPRGIVDGMSRDSRKRLFDWLNSIDWDRCRVPLFFTCTYGQSWPTFRESKRHLAAFHRRLRRSYGNIGMLWRFELQERGAPHFHMLLFGPEFIDKEEIQSMWAHVVGRRYWDRSGAALRFPFTRIEKLRSVHGVKWYVGKYIAKVTPGREVGAALGDGCNGSESLGFNSTAYSAASQESTGRCWGVMGRQFVPRVECEDYLVCPFGDWAAALRMVANLDWEGIGLSGNDIYRGFTLYFRKGGYEEFQRKLEWLLKNANGHSGDSEAVRRAARDLVLRMFRDECPRVVEEGASSDECGSDTVRNVGSGGCESIGAREGACPSGVGGRCGGEDDRTGGGHPDRIGGRGGSRRQSSASLAAT